MLPLNRNLRSTIFGQLCLCRHCDIIRGMFVLIRYVRKEKEETRGLTKFTYVLI